MGKALFGTHAAPSSMRLLDEVRSLRERVAELEAALAAAEQAHAELTDAELEHAEHAERQPASR